MPGESPIWDYLSIMLLGPTDGPEFNYFGWDNMQGGMSPGDVSGCDHDLCGLFDKLLNLLCLLDLPLVQQSQVSPQQRLPHIMPFGVLWLWLSMPPMRLYSTLLIVYQQLRVYLMRHWLLTLQ